MTRPSKSAKPSGAKPPPAQVLSINRLTLDPDIQPRKDEDIDVLRDYTAAWLDGADFPPCAVYWERDTDTYWLADGFHRVRSAIKANLKSIKAHVYLGDKRDAILHSVGANCEHGLRRSNDDKRSAIVKLLDDPEWCLWSNEEIAKACRVSRIMVNDYRNRMINLRGHSVTSRINSNGHVFTTVSPNGSAMADSSSGSSHARSQHAMKEAPLTKSEIHELYASKIAKYLRKSDPSTRLSVPYEFGTVEIVTSTRLYHTLIGRDADFIYRVIGRLVVARHLIDPSLGITLIGHFSPNMEKLIAVLKDMDVECVTPDQILRGKGKDRTANVVKDVPKFLVV